MDSLPIAACIEAATRLVALVIDGVSVVMAPQWHTQFSGGLNALNLGLYNLATSGTI